MDNRTSEHPFADLEIRIFPCEEGRGYPVEFTLATPDGQQEFPPGHLPADILPWVAGSDPLADGRRLLEALLSDEKLRTAWGEIRGQAPRRRIRLRISPSSQAAALHTLPWEWLSEEGDGGRVISAQDDTPFSRYLPIALPWGAPIEAQERPIRILALISNPTDIAEKYDLPPADVAQERASLENALAEASGGPGSVQFHLDFLEPPVTLTRLEEKLRQGYHILHYLGHGAFSPRRGQAVLYMQTETGETALVHDDQLAAMLARQGVRPRLVFLAACQSATQSTYDAFLGMAPRLITVGVPAVVAMRDLISVESALTFGAQFYRRLIEHGQVDLAVNQARSALLTAGRPDAGVPVLFMRLRSGQLWSAEADARGTVLGPPNPRVFWNGLVTHIKRGRSTPIIGPRARGPLFPTPEELARAWKSEHQYPFLGFATAAQIAQYLASSQGEEFPCYEIISDLTQTVIERLPPHLRPDGDFETISALVTHVGWEHISALNPYDVHRTLAELDLPLYVTTNFDNLMVEALRAQGKQPIREVCRWNDALDGLPSAFDDPSYRPTPETPLVYHLFGSDEEPDSLVVTEDQHLDFLVRISAEPERIPAPIWATLSNTSLMFLGFRQNDLGFRVITRGLVATRPRRQRIKHIGVQIDPVGVTIADLAAAQYFLQQYFQDIEVNVYAGTLDQFIAELREKWEEASGR